MHSELIIRGTVMALREMRDLETKRIVGYSAQFLKRNGRNTFDLLSVKLPENGDPSKYAEGTTLEVVVDVSTFEKNIYYRATHDPVPVKLDGRGHERATATAPKSAAAAS